MKKLLKYSFFDMIRNRWMFIYLGFYLLITFGLLFLSRDLTKVIVSLANIVLVLTPLVGILFGTMYYYNSREFIGLLLALPIARKSVIRGMYLGLVLSLCISIVLGIGIPMILFGVLTSASLHPFLILLFIAVMITIIFTGLAFLIALRFENKIKGLGVSIFFWLFFAVLYDGIFLLILLFFKDYPLEKLSLGLTIFNPIDLSRILLLLKLDISAIMGYTGAVFQKFFGSSLGAVAILVTLLLWIVIPNYFMIHLGKKKDF